MNALWHGGTIYTMEAEGTTTEAVLVSDDRIEKIGAYEELKPFADKEINLKGASMYPGLVDSHMHMIGHGEKLMRVDLSKIESSEEMREQLIESTKELKEDDWFIGKAGMKIILQTVKYSIAMSLMKLVSHQCC
nr:amidohydrolase family protein [Planococcus faecalis]